MRPCGDSKRKRRVVRFACITDSIASRRSSGHDSTHSSTVVASLRIVAAYVGRRANRDRMMNLDQDPVTLRSA